MLHRPRTRSARRAAAATACALAATFVVIGPAAPAQAATVTVTTNVDVRSAADGVLSLREAVDLANAAATPTTIALGVPGPFVLDDCAADGDDDNTAGDLDLTGTQPVTLSAGGELVDQLCGGERHVHVVTTSGNLTVVGGTFTSGTGEFPGGGSILTAGDTTLDGTTVNGSGSAGAAAIDVDTGGSLVVDGATVTGNSSDGIGLTFGGSVTITDSTITDNGGAGVNLTDGALNVAGSTVTGNGSYGLRTTGQGTGSMSVLDSVVSDNGGAGITCSNCGSLTVERSSVVGNGLGGAQYGGIQVGVDLDPPSAVAVTLTEVEVRDNGSALDGGALAVTITTDNPVAPVPEILIEQSTISGNTADQRGGAVYAALGHVTVRNSTLSGNSSGAGAGSIDTDAAPLTLQHATVVDGSGLFTDEIEAPGVDAFASIVGTVTDETLDCTLDAGAVSVSSVSGDATCGGTVADPQLGGLAANGGPTATRLPAATSPALGLVAIAACTVAPIDQRGVARPQGPACDAGAVEVAELPPGPACTVNGTPGRDVLVGTSGPDVICAGGGNDVIAAGGGHDTVVAGGGNDLVLAGPGNDTVDAGAGNDVIDGGAGADTLLGAAGSDLLLGGAGADSADGGPGHDACVAETRTSC